MLPVALTALSGLTGGTGGGGAGGMMDSGSATSSTGPTTTESGRSSNIVSYGPRTKGVDIQSLMVIGAVVIAGFLLFRRK
jgi:hypothetical protein